MYVFLIGYKQKKYELSEIIAIVMLGMTGNGKIYYIRIIINLLYAQTLFVSLFLGIPVDHGII